MPLLDHFHRPHSDDLPWESVNTVWIVAVVAELNRTLPRDRFRAYARRAKGVFPDDVEVRIVDVSNRSRIAAAIDFVCPSNKEGAQEQVLFIAKCSNYMANRMGLVMVDVVTNHFTNLHNSLVRLCGFKYKPSLSDSTTTYCVSYRATHRDDETIIDCTEYVLEIGRKLPKVSVALRDAEPVMLDLEATYQTALEQSGA